MKAAVVERPHVAVWRDVETPAAGPGEALVRSLRAGVCRTDLEIASGGLSDPRFVRLPCVPGHEWSGVVEALGEGVRDLAVGERVVCEGNVPCLACRFCKAGETNLCESHDEIGFTRPGGYAELVVVPRHVVHRLADSVSLDAAVLVEPAASVLRGLERGRIAPGERVGVVGIGTLGSLALQLAALWSPAELVAFGVREEELAWARALGATAVVDARATDAQAGGLDLVLETAGAVEAVDLATRLVRRGGRAVLLGVAGEGKTLELPPDRIMLGDNELIGSCSYTTGSFTRVLSLLEQGRVDFERLVTHRFPAERFEEAFALLAERRGTVVKIVLEHGTET